MSWWIVEGVIDEVIRFISGRLRQATRLQRWRSFLWDKCCFHVRWGTMGAFRTVWFFYFFLGMLRCLFGLCLSPTCCGKSPDLILQGSFVIHLWKGTWSSCRPGCDVTSHWMTIRLLLSCGTEIIWLEREFACTLMPGAFAYIPRARVLLLSSEALTLAFAFF